jgi:glycosyl hydrolase family 114
MTSSGRFAAVLIATITLVAAFDHTGETRVRSPIDVPAADGTLEVDGWVPLPVNAPFDYQIGDDYRPVDGVEVVVRDWFEGYPLPDSYSICYVNAFQTEGDDDGVDRPDERSRWPDHLVLSELGDDPDWDGEYLIDLATVEVRQAAADWVDQMIETCADKGFAAVEFDNLDSWTRFDDTPVAEVVPFGPVEAAAYATLLTSAAHAHGLAAAQKNALELDAATIAAIGFDFLVVERCGEFGECDHAAQLYGDELLAIEYEPDAFAAACDTLGERSSVVLRDVAVTRPNSATYRYQEC